MCLYFGYTIDLMIFLCCSFTNFLIKLHSHSIHNLLRLLNNNLNLNLNNSKQLLNLSRSYGIIMISCIDL